MNRFTFIPNTIISISQFCLAHPTCTLTMKICPFSYLHITLHMEQFITVVLRRSTFG